MRDPKPELLALVQEGRRLAAEVARFEQGDPADPITDSVAPRLLGGLFDLHPEDAEDAWDWLRDAHDSSTEKRLTDGYESWAARAAGSLRNISIHRKRMDETGNSGKLVKQFSKTREPAHITTRLRKGLAVLEGVTAENLVYNDEIALVLQTGKGKSRSGRALHAALDPEVMRRLPPEIADRLRGAVEVLDSKNPDAPAQAMASCRMALEAFLRQKTGAPAFGDAMKRLPEGAGKLMAKNAYHYLSAEAIHADRKASRDVAAAGLRLTIEAFRVLT